MNNISFLFKENAEYYIKKEKELSDRFIDVQSTCFMLILKRHNIKVTEDMTKNIDNDDATTAIVNAISMAFTLGYEAAKNEN